MIYKHNAENLRLITTLRKDLKKPNHDLQSTSQKAED